MKLISKLSAIGLALLGIGCSSDEPEYIGIELMYGTPTGSFKIKGKVTSEDGKAVPGATIRVTDSEMQSGIWSSREVVTGQDGGYEAENSAIGRQEKLKVVCLPNDNSLEADSLVVEMKYKRNDKKKPWYEHAEATVDFKLKSKNKE